MLCVLSNIETTFELSGTCMCVRARSLNSAVQDELTGRPEIDRRCLPQSAGFKPPHALVARLFVDCVLS